MSPTSDKFTPVSNEGKLHPNGAKWRSELHDDGEGKGKAHPDKGGD